MSIALWSLGHNTQRVTSSGFIAEYTRSSGEPIDLEKVLPDAAVDDASLVLARLGELHQRLGIDALLISTDPRHRELYFALAIARRLAVFVDKPVFALDGVAVNPARALEYGRRLSELEARVSQSGIDFVVQAQRRAHVGYRLVKALLDDAVTRGCHVTSLHIQHADGMWVGPGEWEREHHPYKYGFGKLLHSGYHFVDAMTQLLERTFEANALTQVDLAVRARMGDAYSRIRAAPQWKPAPRPTKHTRSPCLILPDALHSSYAMGMVAAVVFP